MPTRRLTGRASAIATGSSGGRTSRSWWLIGNLLGLEETNGSDPLASLQWLHNPSHPGEFIIQVYLDPNNLSSRELAGKLGVAASTLNRILTGTSRISPEMALRLSKALGRSPESWLAMQYNHDLWQARQHVKLGKVGKVRLTAA
jgi:antitoxin HigA-1